MISIIIPTYNEEENIIKLINKIFNISLKINIVVVDDSPKSYLNIKKIKNVKYIYRGKKLGRGSAVLIGMKEALKNHKNKIIIEMDADFSHRPGEIAPNIKYFYKEKLNFLIASRYLKRSKILNWPVSRRILSKFSNLMARILLNIPIKDYTNGFRFYDRKAAAYILKKCSRSKSPGFILLSEIAMELYIGKFKIDERPSIFLNRARGESKASLSEIINSFFGLLRLFIRYKLI